MRIVSWNCNGAFRKKFRIIENLDADLIVVQECEDPARSLDDDYRKWSAGSLWMGDSPHRGLAVFTPKDELIQSIRYSSNLDVRHFLHCEWSFGPLCGVWAHRASQGSRHYVGQVCDYLAACPDWLDHKRAIMVGDFNSNIRWDHPRRNWGHAAMVQAYLSRGLHSAYHSSRNIPHGGEPDPSFFMRRDFSRPYHIDYLFAGEGWIVQSAYFGSASEWLKHSDHLPLIVDLEAK